MVFSSLYFLFLFLPVVLGLYYAAPRVLKNPLLLIASIVFYAWGEPIYVILMILSILINYVLGLDIARHEGVGRKVRLIVAVALNLLVLGFFKYYGFVTETVGALFGLETGAVALPLPIGISFYTFQALSYIIDVYRDKVTAQRDLISFALYITMFPQLIAGPIVQYKDIEAQMHHRPFDLLQVTSGAERFILGLAKKVLLANTLGQLATAMQGDAKVGMLGAWLGLFAYTMQIYFDFSGYSDMAIGMGAMFGFTFLENFNYPYIADSITDFWRRWHMSLSGWFRDYVYIPMGGNRVRTWRHILNLLTVWALTGLWHGASWNFVLWGLYYGVLLLVEKYLLKDFLPRLPRALRHIYTLAVVMVSWVFFAFTDPSAGLRYFGALVGVSGLGAEAVYSLLNYGVLLLIGGICCTPLVYKYYRRLSEKIPYISSLLAILALLLSVAFLVHDTFNPFLYFRF